MKKRIPFPFCTAWHGESEKNTGNPFESINQDSMKAIIFPALCILFFSCTKNPVTINSSPTYRLKTVAYAVDTVIPLCNLCPPVITQSLHRYLYDSSGRLVSRYMINKTLSNSPVTADTVDRYFYFYSNNNSTISNYTELKQGYTTNHIVTYNAQNKITLDSVTNPQTSNNKVSRFEYGQGYVIVTDKQTYPIGTETRVDTMTMTNNNVLKETSKQVNSGTASIKYDELTYTFTTYQNPFRFANNISLLGSDYKNNVAATFYNAENYSENLVAQKLTRYWYNNLAATQYTSTFTARTDSLGRITSFANSGNGNKVTSFEYY